MQGLTKNIPIDNDGTLASNSDFIVPSQKAVKTYVDLKESSSNKTTSMTGNTASNILFLTAKAIYDWAVGLFLQIGQPAHRKYYAYDNTTVTVTSSTLETVMRNIPITGGDIGINGKLEIYSNNQKITVSSSSYTLRFYYCTVGTNVIGTTGVPTGGTLLGTCTGTTSVQNYTPFVRRLINKNAENLNELILISANMYNDNTGLLNSQITTTNFDTSVNWWLVMTCQMVGAGDTVNQRDIQLYIDKP